MPDSKTRGLYRKYNVERTDGKPVKEAIVLEFDDPSARVGIRAWVEAVRQDGYGELAEDTIHLLREFEKSLVPDVPGMYEGDLPLIQDDPTFVIPDAEDLRFAGTQGWAKPCPFCGESRVLIRPKKNRSTGIYVYHVSCGNYLICGGDQHFGDLSRDTARQGAIARWNYRAEHYHKSCHEMREIAADMISMAGIALDDCIDLCNRDSFCDPDKIIAEIATTALAGRKFMAMKAQDFKDKYGQQP